MPLPDLNVWAAILAILLSTTAGGAELAGLPIQGRAERPTMLLELGREPASIKTQDAATHVTVGETASHEGDASILIDPDEVSSLHPGFGTWKVAFRFRLEHEAVPGEYLFWARWRQGGEPEVCVQTFELWAGPDTSRLERRATLPLQPKGWEYAWIAAEQPLALKAGDAVIEVRSSGAGHDAKIFDAFLLAPAQAPPMLPVTSTEESPAVLLELGKSPVWESVEKDPAVQVRLGTPTAHDGADSVLTEKEEVQVFHKGFGAWGATFRFDLSPPVPPGIYSVFARYKSGGEVSQVSQLFKVQAGPNSQTLGTRGEFALTNTTPWEYQWLKAESTVTVLPGDTMLQIENFGQADGAKVFDAFLLKLETPLGDRMNAAEAQARNRFLALTQTVPNPDRHLYVLDGNGARGETLFRGLAADSARRWYDKLKVTYRIGPEAEAMAQRLNLTALPAAVVVDDRFTVLGVLSEPKSEAEVPKFLADPGGKGRMPRIKPPETSGPTPLRSGVPEAWLVGGLQDGVAGISIDGLDTETVLRPNPGQPYFSTGLMGGEMRSWQRAATTSNGVTVIEAETKHSYGWSRGSGYAQLYLHVDHPTQVLLRMRQSGTRTAGWLDGRPLAFAADPSPPAETLHLPDFPGEAEVPQQAVLDLSPGWHSLLVKLVMQHDQGQRFFFTARFTDPAGRPLNSITTRLADPAADLGLNALAGKLRPLIYVNAPANLPRPGDTLTLRADIRWHPIAEEKALSAPLLRFQATLRLRLVDYGGEELAVREVRGLFPGEVAVDFGKAPEAGHYAIYPSLYTPEGKLILAYPADGFTVVRGTSAQKERLDRKKLWNNDYYALADGDQGFRQEGGYFAWLERMGIYKSYGAYPGFDPAYRSKWELAKRRGIILFGDSSGDSTWLNDQPEDGRQFVDAVAPFTRFFKATNEIDIRREGDFQKLREPGHWVQRAQWEYESVHRARPDGHYVGGSLVRPGDSGNHQGYPDGLGSGKWFAEVLKLGLDQYQDAWDVHAYPRDPPRFGGPIGNGAGEDERGVLAAYANLGRNNTLPFWLGEAGAKAAYGYTGRRWQAEQAAKMIAWANSRSDYLGLAFCVGHEYDRGYGRLWDYSMGHKPGEAALYTAGALIDGLPYRAVDTRDANVQAAYFGATFMIWRTDDQATDWPLPLDPSRPWAVVDVVGHAQPLPVDSRGTASVRISASPVYVLTRADYERLTRN